ncbi:alpha-(1,3)-fucosyltransferase C-like [Daphnia pulex]|uniref:alpha-(1,3)-fucosyltransferase C-like n=1 Tax=Daphnia pulex TaxID=6669 RepID=UPI001EDFCA3E|nr:alpha-(1,3)-fucosyltransferase C-like [Daphnia pulex]
MKNTCHQRILSAVKTKKSLVIFALTNLVFLLQLYTPVEYSVFDTFSKITGLTRKNKTILIWNSPQILDTAPFGLGHEPFIAHGCEVSDCIVFDQPKILPLEEYDAILVHVHELWKTRMPDFHRQKHQRFVFLTQESPNSMHTIDVTKMGNFFNWTMSYKLNSDVQLLYGRIHPESTAPKTLEETHRMTEAMHLPSARNYAANKTRLVVWMASHCATNSLRETYVKELSKYIPVDIYGRCGNLSCPHSKTNYVSDPKCYEMMETKYKFYLSFENSICNDYVTEKYFEIMNHNMIPIVYGGANYSQFTPHHSYINALDFTPEKLAQYLLLLDANDNFYNEYFWWKDHYRVESGVEQMAQHAFCDLCKKLHQDESVTKFYPELVSQWHPKTQCRDFSSWEKSTTTSSILLP